ncbi:hypothetical protein MMC28_004362 [Mycoblastus sanguinarius]|nr:hypothetical protein [Mycoblastus sanguinarius]
MKIWRMNLQRLIDNRKQLDVDRKAIEEYARQHYTDLSKANRATWNGRQIKNAFQTAIALAEFDAKTKKQVKPVLATEHFEVVAKASEGFDEYLSRIHGTDADRARREGQRDDDIRNSRSKPVLFPMAQKSAKQYESTDPSSSDDSEAREKKKRKKEKKARRRAEEEARSKAKAKAHGSDSDETSS